MKYLNKGSSWSWSNNDNQLFYTKLGITGLKDRAALCGLSEVPDLDNLLNSVPRLTLNRVLEIGAGYGRIADGILRLVPNARVTLVEHSRPSADFLRRRFQSEKRCSLIEGSILTVKLPREVDLALWMWAGFLDFVPEEKRVALKQIASCLSNRGVLAIETPRTVGKEVKREADGSLALDYCGTRWRGHVAEDAEMDFLARSAGLVVWRKIFYETATGLQRTIHLYFRKCA